MFLLSFGLDMCKHAHSKHKVLHPDYLCTLCEQIWLRGHQQKLGRLSAGSKITSLLTANDIILCGSEAGLIKVILTNQFSIRK